jgi:ribosome recycling factor
MVSIRAIRHEALDAIDAAKKAKEVGEDEAKRMTSQIEEAMSKVRTEVEALAQAKEKEIVTL